MVKRLWSVREIHLQVLPRGVVRPGVGVGARRREALVAEGLPDEKGRGGRRNGDVSAYLESLSVAGPVAVGLCATAGIQGPHVIPILK